MNHPDRIRSHFGARGILPKLPLFVCCVLAAAATFAGDTDWIVLPYASASHRMLLHALRDNGKPVSTDLWLETKGRIKSLRIGNSKNGYSFTGVNYCGVAVVATWGEQTRDKNPKPDRRNFTSGHAVNMILRTCRTAEQGVDMLRDAFNKSLISGGLVFMIVDAKRAFIVECSPKHFASSELTNGFCVYANCWKLPNMQDASVRSAAGRNWFGQREWTVCEMLRRARKSGNTVTIAESFAASRIGVAEINAPLFEKAREKGRVHNTPANKTSADGVLFEIDGEFPAVLSCAYVSFGPQRHTVYLPVPLGAADKLPAELTPNPWKAAALARLKSIKPETPVEQKLIEFELRMLEDFAKKREEARRLLREGKTAEAKTLLRENLQRQAQELDNFLKTLGN